MAGGMHEHAKVDRENLVTSLDGAHTHTFKLPDGSIVETEPGGMHSHVLYKDDAWHTSGGGSHSHRIVLNGAEQYTDVDGWHDHETDEAAVHMSGTHAHYVWLPSGEVVMSQSPGDAATKKKRRGKRPGPEMLDAVLAAARKALGDAGQVGVEKAAPRQDEDWGWAEAEDLSPAEPPQRTPARS